MSSTIVEPQAHNKRQGLVAAVRRAVVPATRCAALLLAALFGWHGYRMVYGDRLDIDRAALWYAGALVLLGYFAWDGSVPHLKRWPSAVVTYSVAHRFELIALAVILAGGTFVRLYKFGDLPPTGYLILEEHINSGIAWDIIHGARPYIYPSSRYAGALSQWIFGPSTTGVRAHSVAAGILSIPFFYLLMREVVERPGALFATAIFASLRVLGETSVHYQTPMLVTIIMVWLTMRGLKTGNVIWFVPAAFLAAAVSYEYETWKVVPLFIGPFLVFFAFRAIAFPLTRDTQAIWQRVRSFAPKGAKAIIVITLAMLIGLGPMFADLHRHQHIYFSSLARQEGDRTARNTPGLFAPDAVKQIKWSLQAFTPWVSPDYTVIGPNETGGIVDKVTSALIWIGLIGAALTFWRGTRLLFLAWFVGGVLGAGLLLSNWAPWKVVGFLVPAIVLIGFVTDDAFRLVRRRGPWAVAAVAAALCVLVGLAFYFNVRTIRSNAASNIVLREYSNIPSQAFSVCDNLRKRPADNFAFVSQRANNGWGFSQPTHNFAEEANAWGDYRFACFGLQGQSVPDLQEAWPVYYDEDRPISLVMVGGLDEIPRAVDAIKRAMPEIGDPTLTKEAPGGIFETLIYDTTRARLDARRGLVLRTFLGSTQRSESIAAGPNFALTSDTGATGYTLSGLVYAQPGMDAALEPNSPAARVVVDGVPSFDGAAGGSHPAPLMAGWHLVEVRAEEAPPPALSLQWRSRDGSSSPISPDDLFALSDTGVWRHTRTFSAGPVLEAVRFDYQPHYAVFDGLRVDARNPLPPGTRVTEERYTSRWTVAGGNYRIFVANPPGAFRMTVDGADVISVPNPPALVVKDVDMAAGDHQVELVFAAGSAPYIGGLLRVTDQAGVDVPIEIHPF